MRKSRLFAIHCLLFIFGILIANFLKFDFDEFYIFVIIIFLLVLLILLWQKKKIKLAMLALLFLLLGIWRFGLSLPEINQGHVGYYNNRQIEFVGQIVDEPDVREYNTKLTLGKINICNNVGDTSTCRLRGKLLITLPHYPEYNYGDWLKINCQLEQGGLIEDFDYGQYLAVRGIYAVCYQPEKINIVETPFMASQNYNLSLWQKFRRQILNIKFKYQQIINQSLAYPESEILSSLILGLRRGVPENILNNFRATGLSHIIAISGLHISIITLLLMNAFIAIGFKRKYAFWLASLSLILFLLMIGFRASSIRAGIMGFVALLALQTGRLNKSMNALLLAGCILLLINPQLLLGDVGFQLSFLAVLGIIYLGDYINKFLAKIKIPEDFEIRSSLMMTLSAQAMVLPLIVYYFGNLSLIAPLANVLILPVLPFIMIIGFILGLAGFVFLPLAKIVGLVAEALIDWVLGVANFLQQLPYANFELGKIDFVWILIVYMLLGWGIWLLKNKHPLSF